MISKVLAVVSIIVAFSSAPSAFAQSGVPATTPAAPTVQSQAVLVADINLENVVASYATSTRTVTANATIQNSFGDISNAVFGLELEAQGARDAVFDPQRLSLKEGASVTRNIGLQIPLEISGKVSVLAVVKSLNGVILAAEPIWSGTVASALTGPAPLSCKQGNPSSVSCIVAAGNYSLTYTIYQNALGGRNPSPVEKSNAGGTTSSIPESALSPGHYAALVHLIDARGVVAARAYDLYVDGTQGSIDTIIAQIQSDGTYRIVATTHAFADTRNFTLTFRGQNGAVQCGTPLTVSATSSVTQTAFAPSCATNSIVATLSAGDQTLDTATIYILSTPGGKKSSWLWTVIAIGILLIIGLAAVVMRRRSPPPNPPTQPNPYA